MTTDSNSILSRKKLHDFWQSSWNVADRPIYIAMGDLCLTIRRTSHEWQLNYHWVKKDTQGGLDCEYIDQADQQLIANPNTVANASGQQILPDRIVMEQMSSEISLHPKLADLSVVAQPQSPFIIPSNNKITMYVNTPLWLSVRFSDRVELDLPGQQLSQTWMGLMTGEGQLCYGSKTSARLDKDLLPHLPYRALTQITIHNEGAEDFRLERLNLPVPNLSLYEDVGQLVTEPLSITLDGESQQGHVKIEALAGKQLISPAREIVDHGVLSSALKTLFG